MNLKLLSRAFIPRLKQFVVPVATALALAGSVACEIPEDARDVVGRSRAMHSDLIIFSDLDWESAEIQTRIAGYIIEHGYGYPVELVKGDTNLSWLALTRNDTDITMEIWLPNQSEHWFKAIEKGIVIDAGSSLDDNWQGWVIPRYVQEEYPGLVSVQDIPEHAEVFATAGSSGKARFIGCAKGWSCEEVNDNKIRAYGLEKYIDHVSPPSGPALFADLENAYKHEDPWIGYIWSPTKAAHQLDLVRIEEPPYSEECWETHQGCEYPINEIRIGVHASLAARAPEVLEFLKKWDFNANEQIATETWIDDQNETLPNAVLWYLINFKEIWHQFVPPEIASKVDRAVAEKNRKITST